jgi:5-methylthioadenosine/S-adenosylhomocysteine deaminase
MIDRKEFLRALAAGAAIGIVPHGHAAWAAPGAGAAAHDRRPRATAKGAELLLTDAIVITMDGARRAFRSGFVWLREGRVHRVGAMRELGAVPQGIVRRALGGQLVMPGLVNCHTHLSNGMLRGLYDEMPLETWFSKGMWPVLDGLDRPNGEAAAELALLELMSIGVTTTATGEIGSRHPEMLDGVLGAVERSGIRALVSRIAMDSADASSAAQFIPEGYRDTPAFAADEVRRLKRRYDSDRVTVTPEALGVLRCTPEMVQAMHSVAVEHGCLFTMHAASSQDEREASRKRFGHGSITQLGKLGVLGPRTLLAHAIWLDDAEIALLAAHSTGLSHNPVSNAYYASGIARLPELLKAGVRVGLGVDGASTNNGQNVWETMKMAMLFQKQHREDPGFGSAELALELMTLGGARALHLEHEVGSLEPGKRADLIVIDTGRVSLAPSQTLVSNLVYSNDPWAVRDVYVDGERIVADGSHRALDRPAVVRGATGALDRVLKKAGLDDYLGKRSRWSWQ